MWNDFIATATVFLIWYRSCVRSAARRSSAKLLTKDEARRIAMAISPLPLNTRQNFFVVIVTEL
jgi:hypothetical protein